MSAARCASKKKRTRLWSGGASASRCWATSARCRPRSLASRAVAHLSCSRLLLHCCADLTLDAKVILASLLSFFVPQECGDVEAEPFVSKPCEIKDNIAFNDPSFTLFNKLVVVVNFLLVACFAVLYVTPHSLPVFL